MMVTFLGLVEWWISWGVTFSDDYAVLQFQRITPFRVRVNFPRSCSFEQCPIKEDSGPA